MTGNETGLFNTKFGLDRHGFRNLGAVRWNDSSPRLYELAVARDEGRVSAHGALVVNTVPHTGRSAQDKFVVAYPSTEHTVWWDNNKRMDVASFDRLWDAATAYAQDRDLFVQDLYAGADPANRLRTRIVTETAWHSLFIRHLLIEPGREELPGYEPDYLIVDLPGFQACPDSHGCRSDVVIACDFERRIVLIAGTSYAGEIKKSVFTILNYVLPAKGVMPMHCSANEARDGSGTAVFFGLSGTGKTTLSADPHRILIGDDEHGWSENGVFNFEGGCYAKMIRLSEAAEPEIYATTRKFGTILENVVMDDETGELDLEDASLAENSRGAYPLDYIQNASDNGLGRHPTHIIMLTCDAFGIMPPLARMTPEQAMYHFLSGYTAKVAGTEKGVTEPQTTFSTCFGAPFMPRHPSEYGNLLRDLIARHGVQCWLVNTGWTGGPYGEGERMPIKATRALLNAALSGDLNQVSMRPDPIFGFEVPLRVDGVDTDILSPRETWRDVAAYDGLARDLAMRFVENFKPFAPFVDERVLAAGPKTD